MSSAAKLSTHTHTHTRRRGPLFFARAALATSSVLAVGNAASPRRTPKSSHDLIHRAEGRTTTDAILWTTVGGYALQILSRHVVTALGAKVNEKILAGQVWRLLTPALLHGSVTHLFVNCLSLHTIGPIVEARFGRDAFLTLYAVGTISGNVMSLKFSPNNAVGASAAIFGLVGALGVYLNRHKDIFGPSADHQLKSLSTAVASNIMYGVFMSRNVDNWAHLGGFLGGAALAWGAGPNMHYDNRGRLCDAPVAQTLVRRMVNDTARGLRGALGDGKNTTAMSRRAKRERGWGEPEPGSRGNRR